MIDCSVVDLETTGLDPFRDGITEIAALKIRNGEVVDTFQQLVNPEMSIPEVVAEKTHITDEMVADAPCLKEVLPRFLEFVGADMLLGYNIDKFDLKFIKNKAKYLLHVQFCARTLDVYQLAKRKLDGLESYRLDSVREALGIGADGAHRALKDCEDTLEVYRQIDCLPDKVRLGLRQWVDCNYPRPTAEEEESIRLYEEAIARAKALMAKIPRPFYPVMKPLVPTDYKSRWEYVRNHPFPSFASSIVSVTGNCQKVPRMVAEEILARLGAKIKSSTTRDCDFCVVLSECEYSSSKFNAAQKWQAKGSPIRIIGPEEFLQIMDASLRERAPGGAADRENGECEQEEAITQDLLALWRAEFTDLWNMMLADDVIDPAELKWLRDWLCRHKRKNNDYANMLAVIDKVACDGVVGADESQELYAAAAEVLESLKRN